MRKAHALIPTSYAEAVQTLGDRDARVLNPICRLERGRKPGEICLVLHATTIVTWWPTTRDGYYAVELNSGGYRTNTTKTYINRALFGSGWHVFQSRFSWYVGNTQNEATADFYDGYVIAGLV